MKINKIFLLAFTLLLAGSPALTQASTSTQTVIFSEVAWAGSSLSNSDEWLELSNIGSQKVDISGWLIEGASSSPLTVPNETVLEPYSTYLISNYDETHENSSLNRTPNFTSTSLSLSNSKLNLVLKNSSGSEVDVAGNAGTPFAGGTGNTGGSNDGQFSSMVRRSNGLAGSEIEAWESSVVSNGFKDGSTELGTPGSLESWFTQTQPETETETPNSEPEPEPTPEPEQNAFDKTESLPDEQASDSTEEETTTEDIYETVVISLQINEFVSTPLSGEFEWIELINRSTESVNTKGWTIEDSTGKQTALTETDLKPIEYLVIEKPLAKLNNSGDSIILRNPDGVIVDKVEYGTKSIPAPKAGSSLIRNVYKGFIETFAPSKGDHNKFVAKEDVVVAETITTELVEVIENNESQIPKLSETATKVQTAETLQVATEIKLSEIYPNTLGQDETEEYIKLFNFGTKQVPLQGWSVQDASLKTFTFKDGVINPNSELTLSRPTSKITLNNTSETVRLFNPNGSLVDEQTYENAKQGSKLILTNGQWLWSGNSPKNESSPLQNNQTPKASSNKSVGTSSRTTSTFSSLLIQDAKLLKDETKVTINGYATVANNIFSTRTFYVKDSTGGIQIYKHDAILPEIQEGQKVKVSGILSTSRGERRVKVTGLESIVLEDEYEFIHETELDSLDNLENHIGNLVKVSGIVLSRTDRLALLEGNSNDWTIEFTEGTNIDPTVFSSGKTVEVTGILIRLDESFKVRPRSINDIEVKEVEAEQNQPIATSGSTDDSGGQTAGYVILISTLLLISGFWLARKIKKQSYAQKPAYSV